MAGSCAGRKDLLLIEGAMGLYDGGAGGRGSCARMALALDLPILLLLDCQGLGQSVAALAQGYLCHRPPWLKKGQRLNFCGLLLNRVGSARHQEMLASALAPLMRRAQLKFLGFLTREGAPKLSSRHLGLVQAHEADANNSLAEASLAEWFSAHCDLAALLAALSLPTFPQAGPGRQACLDKSALCLRSPAPLSEPEASAIPGEFAQNLAPQACLKQQSPCTSWPARFFRPKRSVRASLRIGIANDAAFSFCYADLPALLAEMGAEVCFFSPLCDPAPPPGCAALYFPGGYPEEHLPALSGNQTMLHALRSLASQGMPIYGECGGLLYLLEGFWREERFWPLAGLLPGQASLGPRLAELGLRKAQCLAGWPCAKPISLRGHLFHYARMQGQSQAKPLWKLWDSAGLELGLAGLREGNVAASWLHLYPAGSRAFWRAWLGLGRNFLQGRKRNEAESANRAICAQKPLPNADSVGEAKAQKFSSGEGNV